MDEWIPVNGTYRGGIELLSIHRYLIPVWYKSLGMRLPKIVFLGVDGWSTGPPGFRASVNKTILYLPNFYHCCLELFSPLQWCQKLVIIMIFFIFKIDHKTTTNF